MEKKYLAVAGTFLGLYGIIAVIENAYFSAPFYGVATPFWATWVGNLPLWSYDALDFLALVGVVVLMFGATRKPKRKGRRSRA